jgi:hypothetical protein
MDSSWEKRLVDRVEAVARTLLREAAVIDSTVDHDMALKRAMDRRPPARQGSSSTFDCIITECALRIAAGREPGSTFLLTSNRKDFGDDRHRLHPDLAVEFATAGLEYAVAWSEVAGRLGVSVPQRAGWTCDTCGEEVTLEEGFMVWARQELGEGDFRLIHRYRCDPGNAVYTFSQSLSDFVGPDGLSYLMTFLGLGPIKLALGERRDAPLVSSLDEFVDVVRRVHVPGYDQLRFVYTQPDVLAEFGSWDEGSPYQQAVIDELLDE